MAVHCDIGLAMIAVLAVTLLPQRTWLHGRIAPTTPQASMFMRSFRHFLSDQCPGNRRWLIYDNEHSYPAGLYCDLEAAISSTQCRHRSISGVPPIEHLKAIGLPRSPLWLEPPSSTRGGAVMFLLHII